MRIDRRGAGIRFGEERAGVFAQIGRIYEQRLGAPDRAMHYYESALAVDPECLPANQSLFEHYFLAGDWTDTGLPGTIEGAVRSGHAAAQGVLKHLK